MKVDVGEVLSRSWQISWKNKSLWIIGVVLMLVSFLFIPIFFIPMIADITDVTLDDSLTLLLFLGGSILFFVIFYPVAVLLNASLTQGVVHAERAQERPPLMELVRESLPFFWRYLGVMTLFMGALLLFFLVVFVLMGLLSAITFGFGMICMLPLSFLQYPLMLVWYVCMEQALTAVVVDNMKVIDAIKHSWYLFKNNIFTFVIVGLVFYFGISMLSSFLIMPFMFPLFFLPAAAMEGGELGGLLMILGIIFMIVFFPFFCFFQGGVMTLMKSGWVVTYLRLSQLSNAPQVISQEVPA